MSAAWEDILSAQIWNVGIFPDDWYVFATERDDYEQEGDVPWQAGWLQSSPFSWGSSKSE